MAFLFSRFLGRSLMRTGSSRYVWDDSRMGQHMEKTSEGTRKSDSGYISKVSYYQAKRSEGCPLKCICYKAEGNRRRIKVNHNLNRHKELVRQLLTSGEGLYYRSMRPIEPESVFGQGIFEFYLRNISY